MPFFRHCNPRDRVIEKLKFADFGKRQREVGIQRLAMFNEELKNINFVAGDHFSVANITIYA